VALDEAEEGEVMERRSHVDAWLVAVIWIVLAAWAVTCWGESLAKSGVVRLTVHEPGGVIGYGSGALVRLPTGEDGYVLTVAHNVTDGAERIQVCVDGRVCVPGELLAVEPKDDLALIRISLDGCGGIPFAESDPATGDCLTVWGMGPKDGQRLSRSGRCRGFANFTRPPFVGRDVPTEAGQGVLIVSAPARGGDSGGPIVDSAGRLVGLITGSDYQTETVGPCCSRIRAFLHGFCQGRKDPFPAPAPIVKPPIPIPTGPVPPSGGCQPCPQGEPGPAGPQGKPGKQGPPGPSPLLDDVVDALVERIRTDPTFLLAVAELVKVEQSAFPDHGPLTFQLLDPAGKVRLNSDGSPAESRAGYARKPGEKVQFQLVPVQKAK